MRNVPVDNESIIAALPYGAGFRFVDRIDHIDAMRVSGTCYLDPDWPFFKAHFVNYPVVPGVILIEVMAQIGLACLAVYLNRAGMSAERPAAGGQDPLITGSGAGRVPEDGSAAGTPNNGTAVGTAGDMLWAFSGAEVQFLKPVFPGEQVRAESERIYYRFGKLKCQVQLYNEAGELVCEGVLAGLLVDPVQRGGGNGQRVV